MIPRTIPNVTYQEANEILSSAIKSGNIDLIASTLEQMKKLKELDDKLEDIEGMISGSII